MNAITNFSKARTRVEEELLIKASQDAGFRDLLKSDPHAALKDLMGIDPLPSFRITVIEEQAGEITLVLPRAIDQDELPEELLDLASGGENPYTATVKGKFNAIIDFSQGKN